jgi:hypothetical protein
MYNMHCLCKYIYIYPNRIDAWNDFRLTFRLHPLPRLKSSNFLEKQNKKKTRTRKINQKNKTKNKTEKKRKLFRGPQTRSPTLYVLYV